MRSDGLLRIYTLTTPYGEFTVHGDQMLRMRVNELAALHELEKIANSEVLRQSAARRRPEPAQIHRASDHRSRRKRSATP